MFLEPMSLLPDCIVQQGTCGMFFLDAILALVWTMGFHFLFLRLPTYHPSVVEPLPLLWLSVFFFGVCDLIFLLFGGAWKTLNFLDY